jgi:peptidoglycan-associated lipoprotein
MHQRTGSRALVLSVLACLLVVSVGCAHVNREELATELETVRAETRAEREAGDAALGERIDGVESRMSTRMDAIERRQAETEQRLEQLQRSLSELETELGVTIERLEGAIAFSVPLYFEFDSATIADNQTELLDRFAGIYSEYYTGDVLTVEGFTDEAGSEAYNMQLGRRRAEEVRSYLTEVAGLEEGRVRAVSYGETPDRLMAPGQWGHERGQENRRVVLVIEGPAATQMMGAAGSSSGSQ